MNELNEILLDMHFIIPQLIKRSAVNISISFRREMIDIKQLFKSFFVSDFSDTVASLLSDYKPDSRLRSRQNGPLFYSRQVRTKTFFFYSNRVVSILNRLPTNLRQEHSLDGFVRKLNSFYYLKFQNIFKCDNICSWTSTCGCQACACYLYYHNEHVLTQYYQQSTCMAYHRYYCNLYC